MITTSTTDQMCYEEVRQSEHPTCFVCGNGLHDGLGVRFRVRESGAVEGTLECHRYFEGYPEVMHGGVICMLLDAGMTNCLFSSGIVAVTGDMNIRFLKPIETHGMLTVRAGIETSQDPLYKVSSEILQDGIVKAKGSARFVKRSVANQLVKPRANGRLPNGRLLNGPRANGQLGER
ncbi:Thioesterase superfamily protein [Planctomycetes bacterium CA13]|uniref:Acyl-coenzyme A thioesterase THEM4 n=1 Tax=Novipirellula herctigrandis TaxID=2527986 RepID=A0A5C5YW60_9BACT|nr:Thioesterase superfamily protein [Planctomycetes bacterium CA13]